MSRRYWGPTSGWQEAVEPVDVPVPGFEAFQFFTCSTNEEKGYRLTEASTGLSIIQCEYSPLFSYVTREAAVADGIALLSTVGPEVFAEKIRKELASRADEPVQEAASA